MTAPGQLFANPARVLVDATPLAPGNGVNWISKGQNPWSNQASDFASSADSATGGCPESRLAASVLDDEVLRLLTGLGVQPLVVRGLHEVRGGPSSCPAMPLFRGELDQGTASITTPAEFGESQTSASARR